MKAYKKNHVSMYGIVAMLEVIFYLPLWIVKKLYYKERYARYQEVKKVMYNIERVQKQYIQKTLNYTTGKSEMDYTTVPKVWYRFDDNKIDLKVRFLQKVQEKDIEAFLEVVRFATQLKTIDYEAKDLYFFVSLVSSAGQPLPSFITNKQLIPFGTRYGLAIYWNYNKFPHCIISGETGEGKTSLIYYLFSSILSNFKCWCIDGKDVDYWSLRDNFHHYTGIADYHDCFELLKEVQEEMQQRYNVMKAQEKVIYTDIDLEPEFCLIDEFPSVVEALDTFKKSGQKYSQRDEFLRILGDIIRRGRAAGIFVVIAMQRADARYIGGDTRDNMRLKIALGSATEDAYAMLFGNENRKLEELGQGQGYFKQGNELSMFSYYHMKEMELDKQITE